MNDHVDHYEAQNDGDCGLSTVVVLGFAVWSWGLAVGIVVSWFYFNH